jgi:lipopolysaccharide transport system ATP-binding protein
MRVYRLEVIGGLHHRQWLFEPGVNAPSIYLIIQGGLSDSPVWMIKRPGILAPVMPWFIQNNGS